MNELLAFVIAALETVPMNYMLTGSMAMTVYTIPRSTRDIDLVVEVMPSQKEMFLAQFKDRFHFNEQTIIDEFAGKGVGMFNLIDHKSFYKIDFIIRKTNRYEQVKFSNRRRVVIGDTEAWVISPEDLILSKIQWIQQLESERQKEDIRQLLDFSGLNMTYVTSWVDFLKLNTYNLLP
ncbi:nucleotidyl transferase AbiEii/AbiGii toxin family protein [uncultured Fibrella sp.]|uniref:nucleotidyl transferase AbiEii/AbiGii toxin family protein n=1 Tax=uncultured Fibrella sp. TaxID=1284596 RepID=UPI0035CA95C4